MNCMKCGRETEKENVFCQNCLQEMEKYPVRPGTVVLIPRRKETSVIKKIQKRHVPTAEEQIKKLHQWVGTLIVLLAVCIVAIILMFRPTMHYVLDEHVPIGQNYSSVVTVTPTTAPQNTE